MTFSAVIGIAGPDYFYGDVFAGNTGWDFTQVTGCTLDVLDAKGNRLTWNATVPAIPSTWAASTSYAPAANVVPSTLAATGFYYTCLSNAPAAWAANTDYASGAVVSPVAPTGYVYECISAGQSGPAAPAWPAAIGQTIEDGTAVWICSAAAGKSAPNQPAWPTVVNATVTDGALVWKCAGPATTPTAIRWTYVFNTNGNDVQYVGTYQVRARFALAGGGEILVPSRPLPVTGIFGGAI